MNNRQLGSARTARIGPGLLLAFLSAGLFASCRSTAAAAQPVKSAGSAAAGEKTPKSEADRAAEITLAELELATAQVESQKEVGGAEQALQLAELRLKEARSALEEFTVRKRPLRVQEARLELDRAAGRAADAKAELAELEAMYAEDEFAATTKELVLTRGRRDLEHAERSLQIQQTKLTNLSEEELPREERKLQREALEKQGALETTQMALELARIKGQKAVRAAEHKLEKLRRETTADES